MFRVFHSIRLIAAFCLTLTFAAAAFSDTLRLKDGSIFKGRIVTFDGGRFTIVVGEGTRQRQMTFTAEEVESIQFDSALAKADVPAVQTAGPRTPDTPQYIETSAPPKKVPRVVTTDPLGPPAKQMPETPAVADRVPETLPRVGRKPIEVSVKVLADNTANGWTNSGFVVRKGQKIRIIGGGNISLGGGKSTGPSGLYDVDDPAKLLKSVPTGGTHRRYRRR